MDNCDKIEIYVNVAGRDFVLPFIRRALSQYVVSDTVTDTAGYAVMISTVDVYDVAAGENINELAPVNDVSEAIRAEAVFIDECRRAGIAPTILRCANIVGTGMDGLPRRIAEGIWRGVFADIKDNTARQSFVHASDLGQAIELTLGSGDVFNVTDGVDCQIAEFADAMAWRMGQKRVFSVPAWIFKFVYGKQFYKCLTNTLTFSGEKLRSRGFKAVSVTDYLKNHIYDNESL